MHIKHSVNFYNESKQLYHAENAKCKTVLFTREQTNKKFQMYMWYF